MTQPGARRPDVAASSDAESWYHSRVDLVIVFFLKLHLLAARRWRAPRRQSLRSHPARIA